MGPPNLGVVLLVFAAVAVAVAVAVAAAAAASTAAAEAATDIGIDTVADATDTVCCSLQLQFGPGGKGVSLSESVSDGGSARPARWVWQ